MYTGNGAAASGTLTPDTLAAALAYADLGWPVLPIWWLPPDGSCACGNPNCSSPGKHPIGALVPNGLDGATRDERTIREWLRRYPLANLAVRTGRESGLLVVDIDGPIGEASLARLEREHGPLPDLYPMQRTGSGHGWQVLLRYPEGRTIGNSGGRLGRKLDTRGNRGYVLVPPSRTAHAYAWELDRGPWTLPPEPPPPWLLDLLDPAVQEEAARVVWPVWNGPQRSAEHDRYALRALEAELSITAASPKGRRNDQLNRSAHALFRFCTADRLDADIVRRGLMAAAVHAGLDTHEAERTIRSAAASRGVSL